MKRTNILIAVFCAMLFASCTMQHEDERIVTVTVEPQRYFAEQIAGEKFGVECVVPAGQSPETYDPTPRQMIRIGKSRAYMQVGPIGFEQAWIDKIRDNNPGLKFYDTSRGMTMLATGTEHHEGHHHHGGVDPHIWSSTSGAAAIATNMKDAFCELDPDNADYYRKNYAKLMAKIDETRQEIHRRVDTLTARSFIIYHPALTYYASEYNLCQLCIEMDGKEPSPAQLKQLVETARSSGARVVFVQQEFDSKNAEQIARETGCRLEVINPLSYDWHGEMIRIAKALADEGTAD